MPLYRNKFEVSGELVDELRSRFLDEVNSGPEAADKYHPDDIDQVKNNDWYIVRYILHQEFNVDNALKMMKKALLFRKEMEVNTIKREDLPEEYFEARTLQIYNHCNHNFPVVALRGKAHKKNTDETRLHQQYMLYWVEKATRMDNWGGVTVLFDCTDASYKNVDLDMTKFMLTLFQQYYPWTMHMFMVYNMPWYLSALWKLIKTWIPEKHMSRVVFVDKKSIREHIDEDQLPICMGGTCTDQYDSKLVEESPRGWF